MAEFSPLQELKRKRDMYNLNFSDGKIDLITMQRGFMDDVIRYLENMEERWKAAIAGGVEDLELKRLKENAVRAVDGLKK